MANLKPVSTASKKVTTNTRIVKTRGAQQRSINNARVLRHSRGTSTANQPYTRGTYQEDINPSEDLSLGQGRKNQQYSPLKQRENEQLTPSSRTSSKTNALPAYNGERLESESRNKSQFTAPLERGSVGEGNRPDNLPVSDDPERRRAQERVERLRERQQQRENNRGGLVEKGKNLMKLSAISWLYVPAGLIALLKDLLDFILVGSLPILGTIVTIVFSTGVFLLLLIPQMFSENTTGVPFRVLRAFLIDVIGTIIEFFPGVNFFPIETVVVILVFVIDNINLVMKVMPTPKPIQYISSLRR